MKKSYLTEVFMNLFHCKRTKKVFHCKARVISNVIPITFNYKHNFKYPAMNTSSIIKKSSPFPVFSNYNTLQYPETGNEGLKQHSKPGIRNVI